MSNRLLWILIIIWFIWAGYLYYHLIYTPEQKNQIKQELELKNKIIEEKKEPELIIQDKKEIKLTNLEKIEEIKEKNKSYETFKLFNGLNTYFIEDLNKIELHIEGKKIWTFDLVYKQYLRVDLVLWSERDLYIEVWTDKFYYNDKTKIISRIELNIPVVYTKLWINSKLIFVTKKGSFIYSIYNKTLEYFSYFNDFVYFNGWYIWLVREEDKRILKNLWFKSDNNIIVFYNSDTKEKKIIYKTDINIENIYIYNNKLYFVTVDWKMFELENI